MRMAAKNLEKLTTDQNYLCKHQKTEHLVRFFGSLFSG